MADRFEPGPQKLEIRKYPNRRYYDATRSRHVTLDEIRSLVQRGADLTVTDARTGADITAQVLTQIILELETAKLDSFPVPLLLRVIRLNDQLVKDFIEKYFNQALKSFLDYQRQLEDQLRQAQGLPAAFPSVSAWTQAMLAPFAGAPPGPSATAPAATGPAAEADLRRVVRDLQKQVAQLKRAKARKRAARRAGRRRRG